MNLKNDENARARLNDPRELLMHFAGRSGDIERTLDDDEEFCSKEIDAQLKHMDRIDEKWRKKVQERREQLAQLKEANQKASEENKKQYDDEMEAINELFSLGQRTEGECCRSVPVNAINNRFFAIQALQRFEDYERRFAARTTLIQHVPILHINEADIDQYFSSKKASVLPASTNGTRNPTPSSIVIDRREDLTEDPFVSPKEALRMRKEVPTDTISTDDKDTNEFDSLPEVKSVSRWMCVHHHRAFSISRSNFGILSRSTVKPSADVHDANA